MDNNPQVNQPIHSANPAELLSAQTRSLAELVEIQKAQIIFVLSIFGLAVGGLFGG